MANSKRICLNKLYQQLFIFVANYQLNRINNTEIMNQNKKKSKATLNYYVDIIAFLPFLLLLLTGIVMLAYHGGKPYDAKTIGVDGYTWIQIHRIFTIIATPLVIFHLIMHLDWLKKLFTFKLKNKRRGVNITLFIFFLLSALTSLFSWLIFGSSNIGNALRGVHNKFGILLIIFFIIHLIVYFKWIIKMTQRVLNK